MHPRGEANFPNAALAFALRHHWLIVITPVNVIATRLQSPVMCSGIFGIATLVRYLRSVENVFFKAGENGNIGKAWKPDEKAFNPM